MAGNAIHPELLTHGFLSGFRILQSMRNNLVAEQLVHLLECLPLRLGVEVDVTDHGNNVEGKEEVEEGKAQLSQGNGCTLSKDQIQTPVGECGDGVATGTNLGWEDLPTTLVFGHCRALNGCDVQRTSAGYTQEMIPIMVKNRLKTKFIATMARSALSFGFGLFSTT